MKYCSNCGTELSRGVAYCQDCGTATANQGSTVNSNSLSSQTDAPDPGLAVLGFFIPLAGLILYLVYLDTKPLKAKSAGKGALYSVIAVVSFYVLAFCAAIASY
jgi:uncharacterized membrane protein YvbJ